MRTLIASNSKETRFSHAKHNKDGVSFLHLHAVRASNVRHPVKFDKTTKKKRRREERRELERTSEGIPPLRAIGKVNYSIQITETNYRTNGSTP